MKPPAFTYHRPASVAEAVATLRETAGQGKVLAGGQSLVPLLNMRLAEPAHLVDINGLSAELGHVRVEPGAVHIGALARHRDTAADAAAFAVLPLLRQATVHVAHPTIRNRGTTVGSIVHADPAAELPAVLLLCDGSVRLADGTEVAAAQLFVGPLETVLPAGSLVVEARFRTPPAGTGSAWVEVSRRAGDYALCGLGITVTVDPDGRITAARAGYISVAPTPVLVDLTDAVGGQQHDRADWAAAGALALGRVEPEEDIHASAAYRRELVQVLTARAGRAAAAAASPQAAAGAAPASPGKAG
jgi:CO/xanthine dehydrogenase FAD-binding subunit